METLNNIGVKGLMEERELSLRQRNVKKYPMELTKCSFDFFIHCLDHPSICFFRARTLESVYRFIQKTTSYV